MVVTQFFGVVTQFLGWLCNFLGQLYSFFLLWDYFCPINYAFFCCWTTFTLEIMVLSTMQPCLPYMLMREGSALSICRHSNEGNPLTEHGQSLYWACADIIMKGNPLTKTELKLTNLTLTQSLIEGRYTLFN